MMPLPDNVIEELQVQFEGVLGTENSQITDISQIQGGADTINYKATYSSDTRSLDFVLRVYREDLNSGRAKRELELMKILYQADVPLPQVYFKNPATTVLGSPYITMEYIDGKLLSDLLFEVSEKELSDLISEFVRTMFNIHNFEWKDHFPYARKPNIKQNPLAVVDQFLDPARKKLKGYELDELLQVIEWLEEHRERGRSSSLCMIHGDYHPGNIIVRDDSLVVLDWSNTKISDPRIDLAFAEGILSAFRDHTIDLVAIYENLTGNRPDNMDYYMILAHLHNLLRMYSMMFEPEMTDEDHPNLGEIMKTFTPYVKYMIEIVKSICGIELANLKNKIQQ